MRKTGLLMLCLFCVGMAFGQEQENDVKNETKEEKQKQRQLLAPLLFKDRIVLDFFSSIWMGINSDSKIKQKPVNFGFNGAIMFDLPVKKNSPFSFGLGLGVSNHNLYSNAIWEIGDEYTTIMTPVEGIKYRKNKITFTNINIPLEFRYMHRSGFKISAGVRVGLTVDIHSKYFGAALDGRDDKDLFKNYNIPNRTKVPVEFTFKTGWKFVSLNVSYMITKMFTDDGPQIHPVSFGITLCPY
jgi:hypothetical protein